jgi:tetratricopeptide (TPR) repeat protein
LSQALLEEARRRLDAGDPASALRLAQRALALSRGSRPESAVASAAHLVGECLYVTGDVNGALALAVEALQLSEAQGDPAAIGADLNLMGVLEITEGRPADAIGLLRRSLALREESLGADHPDTIESLNNLAVALWRTGEEERAIGMHEDALGRCERALGEEHRRTAETLNALAVKLEARPETWPRSRQVYERALVAAEAALGTDAELVARLLTNVAGARIQSGDLESAGPLLQRSLELHERHFGPSSRWTAYVLASQAIHAEELGRLDDARRAYARAFVIRAHELGPDDAETLDTASGLITVLMQTGSEEDHNLAMALYLPLAAFDPHIAASVPGGASPDPARAREQLLHIADRLAHEHSPDAAGADAIARVGDLTTRADGAYLDGDLVESARLLREAIAVVEDAFGPTDTALVELLERLRRILRFTGHETEVLPILRRIASIYGQAYGELHPLAIRALAEVYWQERREYGPAGGTETAARIELLARDAIGEQGTLGRLLQVVFAAARESVPPGTQLDEVPLSARREQILAEPDPLVDELLPDLDAVPWATLDHAYGPALDTPLHLRLLLATDDRVREDSLELLAESLLHQETVYPATIPAARFMQRLGEDPRVPGRDRLLDLLAFAGKVADDGSGPLHTELGKVLGRA